MKNAIKLFGIIAIVAVIGFSFTACGDDGGGGKDVLDGTTWKATQEYTYVIKFNSPNFTVT